MLDYLRVSLEGYPCPILVSVLKAAIETVVAMVVATVVSTVCATAVETVATLRSRVIGKGTLPICPKIAFFLPRRGSYLRWLSYGIILTVSRFSLVIYFNKIHIVDIDSCFLQSFIIFPDRIARI